jgi:hypothetical protein
MVCAFGQGRYYDITSTQPLLQEGAFKKHSSIVDMIRHYDGYHLGSVDLSAGYKCVINAEDTGISK